MRRLMIATAVVGCASLGWTSLALAQAAQSGTKEQPVAIIETSMGDLHCPLFPKAAPKSTENFEGLAKGTKDWTNPKTHKKEHGVPLYDNTTFHRVIPGFMIQGGDPLGTGTGGPGYAIKDEIVSGLNFDQPGRLAYANSGPNTNGSQFFITEKAYPSLNGHYSIFGQCDEASVELVKKIARQPRDPQDKPHTAIIIKHIRIDDGTAAAKTPVKKTATTGKAPVTR